MEGKPESKWKLTEERRQHPKYKDRNTWRWVIDRNNAYHTVCLPSSFRPMYCGSYVQEGSWGLSTHTGLRVYEVLSVTLCNGQEKPTGTKLGGGVRPAWLRRRGTESSPLYHLLRQQHCCCYEGHITRQKQWNFQAGSRMESIRLPDTNTVGFLLGAGATQRQFIFRALR